MTRLTDAVGAYGERVAMRTLALTMSRIANDFRLLASGPSTGLDEIRLPALQPEAPWYGYSLGDWHPVFDEQARRAALGDYWRIGEELARRRRDDVPPNTPAYPDELSG